MFPKGHLQLREHQTKFPNYFLSSETLFALIFSPAIRKWTNTWPLSSSGPPLWYHIHFSPEAAARLHQFDEDSFWGSVHNKIYCSIFATQALLCSLCSAPAHPASSYSILAHVKPHQTQIRTSIFFHLSAVSLPAPIPSKPESLAPSAIFPVTNGTDKKAQAILYQGGHAIYNNFSDFSCNPNLNLLSLAQITFLLLIPLIKVKATPTQSCLVCLV